MNLQFGHASAGLVCLHSWFQLGLLKLEMLDPLSRWLAAIAGESGLALAGGPAGWRGGLGAPVSLTLGLHRLLGLPPSMDAEWQSDPSPGSKAETHGIFMTSCSVISAILLLQEVITSLSGSGEEK